MAVLDQFRLDGQVVVVTGGGRRPRRVDKGDAPKEPSGRFTRGDAPGSIVTGLAPAAFTKGPGHARN